MMELIYTVLILEARSRNLDNCKLHYDSCRFASYLLLQWTPLLLKMTR